jgi:hypothetical protein
MGPGPLSTLHFLASMLRSLMLAIMAEKQKIIFWLDSGAHFSVLPFSPGPRSNEKVINQGKIWPAPRALLYSDSGLLFGRLPLLSFFLIVPETPVPLLGWDLLSQLKAQILLPPGSYLCCPLL